MFISTHTSMPNPVRNRPRILFVGESVSLAHVARPLGLARQLDPARYDIAKACDLRHQSVVAAAGIRHLELPSMKPELFMKRLAHGAPLYDFSTLRSYVDADRKLLADYRPDLVVGDFRISMSISAHLEGIPFANLCNAHWHPHSTQPFPFPEMSMARVLGTDLARILFKLGLPAALRLHARPYNRLCKSLGVRPVRDVSEAYSRGDWVLFPDLPSLAPLRNQHATEIYIGPPDWSCSGPLPVWWGSLPRQRPLIYATLGSSGSLRVLSALFNALASMPVNVVLATAGRNVPCLPPSNVRVTDFLPGAKVLERAQACIFNGGAATGYQALAAGVPVLGLPSNADQFFFSESVCCNGAGLQERPSAANPASIRRKIEALLRDPVYVEAAERLGGQIRALRVQRRFNHFVQRLLEKRNVDGESAQERKPKALDVVWAPEGRGAGAV